MSPERKRSSLARRPEVEALRHAGRRDKIIALSGLAAALVLALVGLLWGRHTGALAAAAGDGGRLGFPTMTFAGGLVAVLMGIVVLFFGWPLYRLTVTLIGFAIGASLAGGLGWVAAGQTGAFVGGFLGGLVGGLAAWPTEVMIRTLSGAVVGMALGMAVGNWLGGSLPLILCATGGLLTGGALTFLVYKPLIMAYSAILGGLAVVYGVLSLRWPLERQELRPVLLGAAVGLAVLGFLVQSAQAHREKQREK